MHHLQFFNAKQFQGGRGSQARLLLEEEADFPRQFLEWFQTQASLGQKHLATNETQTQSAGNGLGSWEVGGVKLLSYLQTSHLLSSQEMHEFISTIGFLPLSEPVNTSNLLPELMVLPGSPQTMATNNLESTKAQLGTQPHSKDWPDAVLSG